MIAFLMIMGTILVEHFPEGAFPKQDEPYACFSGQLESKRIFKLVWMPMNVGTMQRL